MGIAVGIVAKSIGESQKARSEGGGSSRGRPPGSVHMTRQERSEVPTNLDFGALGGSFGSTHRMRSGISVWFRGFDGGAIECGVERSSQSAMFMEAVGLLRAEVLSAATSRAAAIGRAGLTGVLAPWVSRATSSPRPATPARTWPSCTTCAYWWSSAEDRRGRV